MWIYLKDQLFEFFLLTGEPEVPEYLSSDHLVV